jgi:hypothetical protein
MARGDAKFETCAEAVAYLRDRVMDRAWIIEHGLMPLRTQKAKAEYMGRLVGMCEALEFITVNGSSIWERLDAFDRVRAKVKQ